MLVQEIIAIKSTTKASTPKGLDMIIREKTHRDDYEMVVEMQLMDGRIGYYIIFPDFKRYLIVEGGE